MLAIMCHYDRPLNVLTSSITYVYFLISLPFSVRDLLFFHSRIVEARLLTCSALVKDHAPLGT